MIGKILDLTYKISNCDCPICKKHGLNSIKMLILGNNLICPICKSSFFEKNPFRVIEPMILNMYDKSISNVNSAVCRNYFF